MSFLTCGLKCNCSTEVTFFGSIGKCSSDGIGKLATASESSLFRNRSRRSHCPHFCPPLQQIIFPRKGYVTGLEYLSDVQGDVITVYIRLTRVVLSNSFGGNRHL